MPQDLKSAMLGETTKLEPLVELLFKRWADQQGVQDVDSPQSRYDYRGFWKETGGAPIEPGMFPSHGNGQQLPRHAHFPDTYKQHGHPTFSTESQYSRGLQDGGRWLTDDILMPPPVPSHKGK